MSGRRSIVTLCVLFAAFAASMLARRQAERHSAKVFVQGVQLDFPVAYARILALEHDGALAALLWIRFVQQIPLKPADEQTGRSLARQLHGVVALDPAFRSAYVQGTVLLSVLGNQPCAAVEIAEKGIERFPQDWRIPFQAGYNCFAEIGDPVCASRHMSYASSLPGAPNWLPGLVARLLADASQSDAAVEYLQMQLQRTTDARLRERFEERLQEALLSRDVARLEDLARRFREEKGEYPRSLEELIEAGALQVIPVDPFGGRYELHPGGRVRSSTGNSGLRTFSRQNAFTGDFGERLFDQRLAARVFETFEGQAFVHSSLDQLEKGRVGEGTVKALQSVAGLVDDARRLDLQVLQARAFIRRDVEELSEARLELLREGSRADVIDAIAAQAGVRKTDPFGTPYRMFEGVPAPGPSRNALAAIGTGGGANRCR